MQTCPFFPPLDNVKPSFRSDTPTKKPPNLSQSKLCCESYYCEHHCRRAIVYGIQIDVFLIIEVCHHSLASRYLLSSVCGRGCWLKGSSSSVGACWNMQANCSGVQLFLLASLRSRVYKVIFLKTLFQLVRMRHFRPAAPTSEAVFIQAGDTFMINVWNCWKMQRCQPAISSPSKTVIELWGKMQSCAPENMPRVCLCNRYPQQRRVKHSKKNCLLSKFAKSKKFFYKKVTFSSKWDIKKYFFCREISLNTIGFKIRCLNKSFILKFRHIRHFFPVITRKEKSRSMTDKEEFNFKIWRTS